MMTGTVFVTVGTTKFENLIKSISEDRMLQLLASNGYNKLILQIGTGEYEPKEETIYGIEISVFRLKPQISEYFKSADLVISHAGAGSCLEALNAGKKLITVINDSLMDNHQTELAEELSHLQYCVCCSPKSLYETVENFQSFSLNKYTRGNPQLFADYLDSAFIYQS